MTTQTSPSRPSAGLDGVVAARTRLSRVDGVRGQLLVAGYAIEDLAPKASFEQVAELLLREARPAGPGSPRLAGLTDRTPLAPVVIELLRAAATRRTDPMDALLAGCAALQAAGTDGDAFGVVVGALPALVATYDRLRQGEEPVPPRRDLGHVANYLWMLTGSEPDSSRARALETYFNTVVDHGLNASTFTARVVASTGSDFWSAVPAALAALKGPLHGGAPGPALASLLELRARSGDLDANTRGWVREQVGAAGRIMGFGHRVYKVRDPRADVLGAAADELLRDDPEQSGLFADARVFERAVIETLAELKPGRDLQTNVEFYTALLLHGVGLDPSLFTPTFACARVAGWAAHFEEQVATGRLLRPSAEYVGEALRAFASTADAV